MRTRHEGRHAGGDRHCHEFQSRYSALTRDHDSDCTAMGVQSAAPGGVWKHSMLLAGFSLAVPPVEHIASIVNGGTGHNVTGDPTHTLVYTGASQSTKSGHWKNGLDGGSARATRKRRSAVLQPTLKMSTVSMRISLSVPV